MLYYKQTGSGKTIIFIHGNSQSLEIWNKLIIETALAGYTLLALDMPGHGRSFRSEKPEIDYTLKGIAAHLKEFLEQLTGEYIIVANSLATNLISEVITRLPQCRGLFLTGACVIGPGYPIPVIVQPSPYFGVTFAPDPTDEDLDGLISTQAENMAGALKNTCIQMFSDTDPALRIQEGISLSLGDWTDEVANLEKLKYPVAIVYGEQEKIVYPDYLSSSSIMMWKDRIIKIPGAGHCCQLDQPKKLAELIADYVEDIFRSAGS